MFTLSNATLASGASQASFQGSKLTSCRFAEGATVKSNNRTYFIDVANVVVGTPSAGDPPTHVDGPHVRWNSASGPVGDIAPGTYS